MAYTFTRRAALVGASALAMAASLPAFADGHGHTVQMLNKDPDNPKLRQIFSPRVLYVKAGDTVTFEAADKGHNAEIIKGMAPEAAEGFKGKVNEEFTVTMDVPGIYGYKCTPHASVGMVGLIIVEGDGKLDNLEEAMDVRQRGKAKKAWEDIWEEAKEAGYLEETPAS